MTFIRSQNHLAELLGISKGAASRLAARGMPTDSLEAAQAWRKEHLNPNRVKGNRFDVYRKPSRPASAPQDARLVHAANLMAIAANTLAASLPVYCRVCFPCMCCEWDATGQHGCHRDRACEFPGTISFWSFGKAHNLPLTTTKVEP